jgi:selenocysteine-specific elongation factor
LLVIAADDGVMPQTHEHLAILQLLGVTHGAVALTKTDRVDAARLAQVRGEIQAWLALTPLADAPLFETNATQPDDPGVKRLDTYLHEAALRWHARRDDGLFRLAIDRVFTLAGQGTIVTGTVFAGRVTTGETLMLAPAATPVRVRSIHAQNRAAETGHAGQRCALNLAGIDKDAIARGDWIVDAELAESSERLDVELTLLADAGLTLQHWAPVHVHIGTTHRVAHVALLEGDRLSAGEAARVQLVFDAPVCALPDRTDRARGHRRRCVSSYVTHRRPAPSAVAACSIRSVRRASVARPSGARGSMRCGRGSTSALWSRCLNRRHAACCARR